MKKACFWLCAAAVVVASSCKTPNSQTGGSALKSDGVEFQVQPINNAQVKCSAIILRGTQRFQGTYFAMPRALVSIDRTGERLFGISKAADGKYLMRMAIYFPMANEALTVSRSNLFLHGCDYDAVQAYINRVASEPDKVKWFGRLPVSRIRVSLDGTEQTFDLGREGDSLFNYEGNDHVVEFKLTEDELHDVITRISDGVGMTVSIAFNFQARNSSGVAKIEVNTEQLAQQLDAAFTGQISVVGTDLQAKMSQLLQSSQMNIYIEESDSETFKQISDKLIEMTVTSNPAVVLPSRPVEPETSLPNNPQPARGGQQAADGGSSESGEGGDEGESGGGQSTAGTVAQAVAAGGPKLYDLKAMVKSMKEKRKIMVDYTVMGGKTTFTYRTNTILSGKLGESNVETLELESGKSQQYRLNVSAGDRFTVMPTTRREQKIEYKKSTRYYSLNDVKGKNLPFDPLKWGKALGEYATPDGPRAFVWDGWKLNIFNYKYYVWGQTEASVRQYTDVSQFPENVDAKKADIYIGFDRLPQKKLSEFVAGSGEDYKATFDNQGRLHIEALTDLGKMTFLNREGFRDTKFAKYATEVFQEKYASYKWSDSQFLERVSAPDSSIVGTFPEKRSLIGLKVFTIASQGDRIPLIKLESARDDYGTMKLP